MAVIGLTSQCNIPTLVLDKWFSRTFYEMGKHHTHSLLAIPSPDPDQSKIYGSFADQLSACCIKIIVKRSVNRIVDPITPPGRKKRSLAK